MKRQKIEEELRSVINRYSVENASNTPDFILAKYLMGCLDAFNMAVQQRETWYGRDARPTNTEQPSQDDPTKCTHCGFEMKMHKCNPHKSSQECPMCGGINRKHHPECKFVGKTPKSQEKMYVFIKNKILQWHESKGELSRYLADAIMREI